LRIAKAATDLGAKQVQAPVLQEAGEELAQSKRAGLEKKTLKLR